jgi:hypothetical protein
MKARNLSWLALSLIGVSGFAVAAPTLVGSTTNPTGIDGLVVDGTTYNVVFSTTIFNSPDFAQFQPGSALSVAAAASLAAALTSLRVTELADVPVLGGGINIFAVDNQFGPNDGALCTFDHAPSICSEAIWESVPSHALDITSISNFGPVIQVDHVAGWSEAALFTTKNVAVPEPTTLGLFGLGLVAAWVSRRRLVR